jgi:hypothetical protein
MKDARREGAASQPDAATAFVENAMSLARTGQG